MGIYNQNGVCLGKDYPNSKIFHNLGNIDSIIEPHEWSQGYVLYTEIITLLNNCLNKKYDEKLKELIERISKKLSDDEWYFFELSITSYDGINIDKIDYLPVKF